MRIILKFWLIYTVFRQKLVDFWAQLFPRINFLNNLFKNHSSWGCLVLVFLLVLALNFSGAGRFTPTLGGGPIGGEITEIVSAPIEFSAENIFGYQTTLAASIGPVPDVDLESGDFNDSLLQTTGEDALLPNSSPETQAAPSTPPPTPRPVIPSYAQGPDLGGYFIFPTTGYNRGILHYYNAVDISVGNRCLSDDISVWAAASGVVTTTDWASTVSRYANGGYGNNITVLHPNGVRTRYTHLKEILVTPSQYVNQGQVIAYVGGYPGVYGSGNSTGCHLHFEVRGARNPFIR